MLCRSLAAGSGCRVLSVAYRLAPEHPCPAPFDDAVAALADALASPGRFGLDPDRIAVGGDSAGGTLAIAAALAARHRAGPRPAALLLLCPVLAVVAETASREAFADGYLLDAAMMARDLADHAPDLAEPRLSPLSTTDLGGLPPTLIHTAEHDPLRDEGALFAARLVEAGVPVEHRCHPGMIHPFLRPDGLHPGRPGRPRRHRGRARASAVGRGSLTAGRASRRPGQSRRSPDRMRRCVAASSGA